jgi:hypothetical protein
MLPNGNFLVGSLNPHSEFPVEEHMLSNAKFRVGSLSSPLRISHWGVYDLQWLISNGEFKLTTNNFPSGSICPMTNPEWGV